MTRIFSLMLDAYWAKKTEKDTILYYTILYRTRRLDHEAVRPPEHFCPYEYFYVRLCSLSFSSVSCSALIFECHPPDDVEYYEKLQGSHTFSLHPHGT